MADISFGETLWRALKEKCCSDPDKAHRIVMLDGRVFIETVDKIAKFPPAHCDWADRNDGSDYCALGDALREQLECARDDKYLIWSTENNAWHRADNCGYTVHSSAAGLYSKEDALFASHMCRDGWHKDDHTPQELAIPLSCIPKEFRPNG